jgi:hypothetical protein
MSTKQTSMGGIQTHFAALSDPRKAMNQAHLLLDIVVIALCAVICGADNWVAVADFGQAKAEWFKGFLALPNGIPAHDTFWRVFRWLDAEQFQECFLRWIQAVAQVTQGQIVAIDGKKLGAFA